MTDTSPATTQAPPRLADGVELLGPMAGSGYRTPPHLARRADGQVLQLSPLLAAIAGAIDGHRDLEAIGEHVGRARGRALHADDVAHLVEHQLRRLGLVCPLDGSQPVVRRAEPLLGLRGRLVLTRPARTRAITGPFLWLFRPAVVLAVLAAFAAVSTWVTLRHGLGVAVDDALADPRTVLVLVALILASGAFHEIGHATACRYGGAEPGVMGAAVYLVWPAFYTDVTDSYRLDRRGRLRVDLGGLYFNAVFTVGTTVAWALTGREALLVLVPVQLLQMVRQLVPIVRFDGYHILADLVGVPDLYARIRPTLRRALPWRRDPTPNPLTRRAQVVVVTWVAVVVPALLVSLGLLLWGLPALLGSALRSLDAQSDLMRDNLGAGRVAATLLGVVAMVTVGFVPVSAVYLLSRFAHRSGARFWTLTERRPAVRIAAAGLAAVVAVATLPGLVPAPDAPPDLASTAAGAGSGGAATELAAGAPSRFRAGDPIDPALTAAPTPTLAVEPPPLPAPPPPPAEPAPVPAPTSPAPAAAVIPTTVRPAWPFAFDRPEPPGAGDNQAFALSTHDGGRELAVTSSLEWEPDGLVDNRNEAWALASCVDCEAVAVAFQVVAATAPAPTVVPQNAAVAYNEACERCRTVAVAVQLGVTLGSEPSDEVKAEVADIVARIAGRRDAYATAGAEQIRAELRAAKAEALAVLDPWLLEAEAPDEDPAGEATDAAVGDGTDVEPAATDAADPTVPTEGEPTPTDGTADPSTGPEPPTRSTTTAAQEDTALGTAEEQATPSDTDGTAGSETEETPESTDPLAAAPVTESTTAEEQATEEEPSTEGTPAPEPTDADATGDSTSAEA